MPCIRDVGDQKEGAAVDLRNTKLVHGLFHDHLTVPRHPLEVRQPELTGEKKKHNGDDIMWVPRKGAYLEMAI